MNALDRFHDAYLAVSLAVQGTPSIPYRTEASVSTGSVLSALLWSALLLVALVAVLLYSRRRGWLPTTRSLSPVAADEAIRVLSSRRLSMATVAHLVECQGRVYLISESTRGASSTVTAVAAVAIDPQQEAVS